MVYPSQASQNVIGKVFYLLLRWLDGGRRLADGRLTKRRLAEPS